jgi:hypothetical protein
MKRFDFKKVIGLMGLILRCQICTTKYNLDKISIIETQEDDATGDVRLLIHSDCKKCKSSVMFNVDISGAEIFSVGMLTDLTSQDSSKFSKLEPIEVDEIIDMHQSLRKFDGDLIRALGHVRG